MEEQLISFRVADLHSSKTTPYGLYYSRHETRPCPWGCVFDTLISGHVFRNQSNPAPFIFRKQKSCRQACPGSTLAMQNTSAIHCV